MALITVSGNLFDAGGNPLKQATLFFTLANYSGNLPLVSGTNILAPTKVSFTTDSSGHFSGSIQGNDSITPSGTVYQVDFPGGVSATYSFSGIGPTDLDSYRPVNVIPVPVGSVPTNILTGNNVFTGVQTFSGEASAGNVALKVQASDAIRYVSVNGNDANDGLSMGSAKLTIAGAYNSLPTCSNIAFSANPASPPYVQPCGTIYLSESTTGYTLNSTLSVAGPFVRIIGMGEHPTVLNCTAAVGITWTANSAGSGNTQGVTYSSDFGLYNITLAGNGSANQIGLACIDCTGITLDHVRFANFNGTGAIGSRFLNDANFFTERTMLNNVWWDNCTIGHQISGQGGAAQNSFGHQFWNALQFTLNNGQTAFSAIGNAQLYSSFITGVINTNGPNTNTYTGVSIGGTATIKGPFNLIIDNAGLGTMTATSGATNSNFQVSGWAPNNNLQSPATQDLPYLFNVTGSSATNSPTWQLNNVPKWNIYLDGSNNLNLFDVVNSKATLSFLPNVGAVQAIEGAAPTGFATLDTLWADSTAHRWKMANNSNVPDVVVGANTADTLANKSTSAGPLVGTVASGTATMTTTLIASGTVGTVVTVAAAGVLTTDAISFSFNAAIGANPGVLIVNAWSTAGNVNFQYANPTAAGVTPTAATLNWKVVR